MVGTWAQTAELDTPAAKAPAEASPILSITPASTGALAADAPASAWAIENEFLAIERQISLGQFANAAQAARQLSRLTGPNWRTAYLLGVALSGMGEWEEAVATLTSARNQHANHPRLALHLVVALQETGRHSLALDILQGLTSSQTEMPELWLNLGHTQLALGQKSEARVSFQRFMQASHDRADMQLQKAWVMQQLQKEP
jgi:Flp pilus assembly protein TadD